MTEKSDENDDASKEVILMDKSADAARESGGKEYNGRIQETNECRRERELLSGRSGSPESLPISQVGILRKKEANATKRAQEQEEDTKLAFVALILVHLQ